MQFVDTVLGVGEITQPFHGIRELLRRKSLPAFFAAYNIDNIVTVEMVRQQTVFIRQVVAGADLVKLVQVFFRNRILAVSNEVQTALHAINTGFFLIARGVAVEDMPDAVARGMDAFDLEGCMNFLGHGLQAKGLIACGGGKELLHAVGGDLCQIGQVEQFIAGKIG